MSAQKVTDQNRIIKNFMKLFLLTLTLIISGCDKFGGIFNSSNSVTVESYSCEGKSCDSSCKKIKYAKFEFLIDKNNKSILKKVFFYVDLDKKIIIDN
jgi:hypothetical protein